MRYVLAPLGAAWFLFQSLMFVAPGAFQRDWPLGAVEGQLGAVAITAGVRVICIGSRW